MTETTQLGLPLVQAAQAQKHVTVNEALARIDAVFQLRLAGVEVAVPPVAPLEGEIYSVAAGASGDWTGQDGMLALSLEGLWHFVTPQDGWEAWGVLEADKLRWDGADWRRVAPALGTSGAETVSRVVEADVDVSGGSGTVTTADLIPSGAQVIGVTARVISALSGTGLTTWSLGVAGAEDRHGSGLGTALNSYARGITGQPVTYWAQTPLVLTADAGVFDAGTVRLAVHLTELTVPDPV